MKIDRVSNPFTRSGLAAISDLHRTEWMKLFRLLEKDQFRFLEQERNFRSAEYKWPSDSLHTWSRIWEYPYVYQNLKIWYERHAKNAKPTVIDFGSGVTFFPFAVANMGYKVIGTDIDPVCQKDFKRACEYVQCDNSEVDFRLIEDSTIPFDNDEADAIYCISVIEHIHDFDSSIYEIARALKTGGIFLLTIDLDLRGDADIGIEKYECLLDSLERHFKYSYGDITIHPSDMLTSKAQRSDLNIIEKLYDVVKEDILKPLLGKRSPFLAVQGFVLEKK